MAVVEAVGEEGMVIAVHLASRINRVEGLLLFHSPGLHLPPGLEEIINGDHQAGFGHHRHHRHHPAEAVLGHHFLHRLRPPGVVILVEHHPLREYMVIMLILHRRHLHTAATTTIVGIIGTEIGITTGEITETMTATETVAAITEIIALRVVVGVVHMEGVGVTN